VYEDPWLAGGHNGLSNAENPLQQADPYLRLVDLRKVMSEFGLSALPIIIAGGVWHLSEWEDYIDNKELGPIAFQFGTRSILTTECPVAKSWQPKLMALKRGDVKLTQLSPTGFYSSAINNGMLSELIERKKHQARVVETSSLKIKIGNREFCLDESDTESVKKRIEAGFTVPMLTPDNTVVFVTPEQEKQIRTDQKNCRCCLSMCKFSSWCQQKGSTGRIPDPRTFCIQTTLQAAAHGGDLEKNLVFAGHLAYRFAQDPFYADNFIPTTAQLIDRVLTGY
jgi:NAD(P)H-dependent flavin oxidoreductase YrpB (nitropropane dioxygenase family)